MKKAMLIIDVEVVFGWYDRIENHEEDKKQVALNIKKTLDEERVKDRIIIFIIFPNSETNTAQLHFDRHINSAFSNQRTYSGITDPTGSERQKTTNCLGCDRMVEEKIAAFLEHRHYQDAFEPVFTKDECDAFSNPLLAEYLRSENVEEVLLMGCSTEACILHTAQGALEAGFNVTLLEKCVYPQFQNEYTKQRWLIWATPPKQSSDQNANAAKIQIV